jgi:type 1 glutamine amidotransferase
MRLVNLSIAALLVVAAADVSWAQAPFGKGKGPAADAMALFQNPQVRGELKVTDEQLAKLPAAALRSLEGVLDAGQLKRLREIYLQQKGDRAFLEADVGRDLKITEQQAKSIRGAFDEQAKQQKAMMDDGGFDPIRMQEIQKDTKAKVLATLTQEQKTAWTAMLGRPLQLAFGGPMEPRIPMGKMVELVTAVLPDKAPAQPKHPRKLLIYSKTAGFRHPSIEIGVKTLRMIGEKTGAYTSYSTEDESFFEPEKLKEYDGVFMVSTTGDFLRPSSGTATERKAREEVLRNSLVDFVSSGKGLMGLHAATDSYRSSWPLYANVIGGGFDGHPWTKKVPVKNLQPSNPVNAAFESKDFEVDDEIYQFRLDTASPTHLRFLLALDVDKMGPDAARGNRKTAGPYAVSWIANYGKGRVFYCSLGHKEQIFWNPVVLRHYLAGIQFALGDLEADARPAAKQ